MTTRSPSASSQLTKTSEVDAPLGGTVRAIGAWAPAFPIETGTDKQVTIERSIVPGQAIPPLPAGFIDIEDLIAEEEKIPERAALLAEARQELAGTLYPGEVSLRVLRMRRGWSQARLAEELGTSQPYIARLEAGKVDPQLSTIQRLASALNVTCHELLDAALHKDQ